MNETNWVTDIMPTIDSRAIRVLEKAKKQDEQRKKDGWKEFKISNTTTLLIPCDKKGVPTEQGARMLDNYEKLFR